MISSLVRVKATMAVSSERPNFSNKPLIGNGDTSASKKETKLTKNEKSMTGKITPPCSNTVIRQEEMNTAPKKIYRESNSVPVI